MFQVEDIVEDLALDDDGYYEDDGAANPPPAQVTGSNAAGSSRRRRRLKSSRNQRQSNSIHSEILERDSSIITQSNAADLAMYSNSTGYNSVADNEYLYESAAGSGITIYIMDSGANPESRVSVLSKPSDSWRLTRPAIHSSTRE